jgi:hypothetical protein
MAQLKSYRYAGVSGCLRRNTVFPGIRRPEAPDLVSFVQIWR